MNQDRRQPQRYEEYAEEPDEDPRAKRRNRTILAVVAALLVAGVILLIMWLNGAFRSEATTATIPDVMGHQASVAKSELQTAGFSSFAPNKNVICGASDPSTNPKGLTCTDDMVDKVVSIDPGAGQNVATTTQIQLYVGARPNSATVPDLTGKTPDDARTALEQAKLELGDSTSKPAETPDQVGKVISQNPTPNSSAPEGTKVNIVIGGELQLKQVPDTTGTDYDAAKKKLEGLGFTVKRVDVDSNDPKNQVVNQQPNGGQVAPGSTITLQVSKGVQQITMPDLTGQTEDQATQTLQGMGWSGQIQTESVHFATVPPNTVAKTNPKAGQTISPTQTVVLTIFETDSGGDTTTPTNPGNGGSGGLPPAFPPVRHP
jgi:serine/threonine-protein kinase